MQRQSSFMFTSLVWFPKLVLLNATTDSQDLLRFIDSDLRFLVPVARNRDVISVQLRNEQRSSGRWAGCDSRKRLIDVCIALLKNIYESLAATDIKTFPTSIEEHTVQ